MMWEEKIDSLQKQFDQSDFKVPFTTWAEIMKQIERRFITKQNSSNSFSNWADNIKDRIFVRSMTSEAFSNLLSKLNKSKNYWVVAVMGDSPTSRHYVYDCKPKAISALISIAPNNFFIADKKNDWLTYFQLDRSSNMIAVFKSGKDMTPFDTTK